MTVEHQGPILQKDARGTIVALGYKPSSPHKIEIKVRVEEGVFMHEPAIVTKRGGEPLVAHVLWSWIQPNAGEEQIVFLGVETSDPNAIAPGDCIIQKHTLA